MMSKPSMPPQAPRHTCRRCGMTAVEPISSKSGCTNAAACAKRVARNTAAEKAKQKAAGGNA